MWGRTSSIGDGSRRPRVGHLDASPQRSRSQHLSKWCLWVISTRCKKDVPTIQLAYLRFLQECVVGPFVRREPAASTGAAPYNNSNCFFPPAKESPYSRGKSSPRVMRVPQTNTNPGKRSSVVRSSLSWLPFRDDGQQTRMNLPEPTGAGGLGSGSTTNPRGDRSAPRILAFSPQTRGRLVQSVAVAAVPRFASKQGTYRALRMLIVAFWWT